MEKKSRESHKKKCLMMRGFTRDRERVLYIWQSIIEILKFKRHKISFHVTIMWLKFLNVKETNVQQDFR